MKILGQVCQGFAIITAVVMLAGCAALPRDAPPTGDLPAPVGFSANVRTASIDWRRFQRETKDIVARAAHSAADGKIHILAISGGGSGAAYGAGALVGWSRAGTRPTFQIVTGVSAGALIAPLAFLGSDWDGELRRAFSGEASRDLLQSRWLGVFFGASVYRGRPLRDLVDRFVTPALVSAVAAEAAKGRLLLVATTDLDREQTVLWNLGEIARHGGEPARRLFRDVLVASASIPGIFPPALIRVQQGGRIYEEVHVDGSTTASLFIAPEVASILPGVADGVRGAETYVMVNGQLAAREHAARLQTFSLLKRGLVVSMRSSLRSAAETALLTADELDMEIRMSEIPDDYPFRGPLDFDPDRMSRLFEFGLRCGSQDRIWATPLQTLERNDPFQPGDELSTRMSTRNPVACPAPPAPGQLQTAARVGD
jgi:hypothetical protein